MVVVGRLCVVEEYCVKPLVIRICDRDDTSLATALVLVCDFNHSHHRDKFGHFFVSAIAFEWFNCFILMLLCADWN
jgi:hypothetical protein